MCAPFVILRACRNTQQASKAGYISKVFLDSYKSPLSIILIDDLERVIDFVRTGPRFSNTVLQTLLVLLKKVRRRLRAAGAAAGRAIDIIGGVRDTRRSCACTPVCLVLYRLAGVSAVLSFLCKCHTW